MNRSKAATDTAYNESVKTILSTMADQLKSKTPERALSVVFGTHNDISCDIVIDSLRSHGMASEASVDSSSSTTGGEGAPKLRLRDDVRGKVFVAQLYGMFDCLFFGGLLSLRIPPI